MLGDWVKMKFHLDDTYSTKQVDFISAATDGWLDYEPIPLTPEILEKNGFKYRLDCLYLPNYCTVEKRRSGFKIRCSNYDDGKECTISKLLYYVHELQHALRLCGLNGLADNFKV